jgi:hypothetical protein
MMKLGAGSELRAEIALAEQCGVASRVSAVVVVEWAAVDLACVSDFGGGV